MGLLRTICSATGPPLENSSKQLFPSLGRSATVKPSSWSAIAEIATAWSVTLPSPQFLSAVLATRRVPPQRIQTMREQRISAGVLTLALNVVADMACKRGWKRKYDTQEMGLQASLDRNHVCFLPDQRRAAEYRH